MIWLLILGYTIMFAFTAALFSEAIEPDSTKCILFASVWPITLAAYIGFAAGAAIGRRVKR